MNYLKVVKTISLTLILAVSLTACGLGKSSWKEEVRLHDGSKIVVTRTQIHGGIGELGQSPISEQTISFTLPSSNQLITWQDKHGNDISRANFDLRAIHILNGVPYIITSPNLCLSYNKWGRPNPPYVYFKYVGNTWQRIKLSELPKEFITFNVVQNNIYKGEETLLKLGYVSADKVKELNGKPEFNAIQREPEKLPLDPARGSNVGCDVMVRYRDGEHIMWTSPAGIAGMQRLGRHIVEIKNNSIDENKE